MALLKKAAGQGHVYAMTQLAEIHVQRKEFQHALEWYMKGAEAGYPRAMHNIACCLDQGLGLAAPDYPAAADWYRCGMADIARRVIQGTVNPCVVS